MHKQDQANDGNIQLPGFPQDLGPDLSDDFFEAVAIVGLEGYIPLIGDMQALGQFARGSASLEEYVGLCLEATPIRTPTSSPAQGA